MESAYSCLTGKPKFQARYDWAQWRPSKRSDSITHDMVYVLPPVTSQGWILDAICREIDHFVDGRTASVAADEINVPRAKAYFYSHYEYFRQSLARGQRPGERSLVFFTHPKESSLSSEELVYVLNKADVVVSMCGLFADWLVDLGVDRDRVTVATIGADPALFPAHERKDGAIGFCTAFYERKNPERILEIVRQLPDRRHILLGRNWEKWSRFGELTSLPNFEYRECPYSEYPAFYAMIDVFVSASILEGGPVPLLEAMMSNVFPVASRTGIAPDIIEHGKNGLLFDVDAPAAEIVGLIEEAINCTHIAVRPAVRHLTWERFSNQVQSLAGLL